MGSLLRFAIRPDAHGTTRPKGIDRGARSAEEGECEEFHQFHHGEVEVVCVLLCEEGHGGWEPCM